MNTQTCRDLEVRALTPCCPDHESGTFFELLLENPGWAQWTPGQFVMIRPARSDNFLTWGRPFSICTLDQAGLRLFIQVAGRGTEILARLRPGDKVTTWGPLGTGFVLESGTPALLLAGGVGLAPFAGYVRSHPAPEQLELLFGHRPALACYPFAEIAAAIRAEAFQDHTSADIALFAQKVRERMTNYTQDLVLACGPLPFLRMVQQAANELSIRAQLSLENRMACGVGACLGCVSKDKQGWPVQVCTRGPVFWADAIELTGEAEA